MGAMSAASTGSVPFITGVFQVIGLGFLLVLPNIFYQVLLIIVFAVTVVLSYFSYRGHRNLGPLGLTTLSSFLLYGSIYLFVSEALYWIAFLLMVVSAVWSYRIGAKLRALSKHTVTSVNLGSKDVDLLFLKNEERTARHPQLKPSQRENCQTPRNSQSRKNACATDWTARRYRAHESSKETDIVFRSQRS